MEDTTGKQTKSLAEQADSQYLKGIRERDHYAFTALYRKYFQGLVLASDKYVRDTEVSKEIVQDVFLKIWEYPFDLDHIISLKAYLYRTVINASLNHLKREKNISLHHIKIADETSQSSIDALQEEQELKLIIYNEIERLPPQCKKIFKMSRFEGLKYKEIANLLQISEKTVENHMMKALKTLRERLYPKTDDNSHIKLKILTTILFSTPEFVDIHNFFSVK